MKTLILISLTIVLFGCAKDSLTKAASAAPTAPVPADPIAPPSISIRSVGDIKDSSGKVLGTFLGSSGSVQSGLILKADSTLVNVNLMTGALQSESLAFTSTDCSGAVAYIRPTELYVPMVMKNRIVKSGSAFYKVTGVSSSAGNLLSYYVNGSCSAISNLITAGQTPVLELVTDSVSDFSMVAPIALTFQ